MPHAYLTVSFLWCGSNTSAATPAAAGRVASCGRCCNRQFFFPSFFFLFEVPRGVNAFTTGNPFLETFLLEVSVGGIWGLLRGLTGTLR